MKAKHAGILSAVLGSICCVGPLVLIALGLGTGAAVIGRYHWLFIAAAIAVLAWAWAKHIRERNRCACEHRVIDGRRISFHLTACGIGPMNKREAIVQARGGTGHPRTEWTGPPQSRIL